MFHARLGFAGAGPSGVESFEGPGLRLEGSNPEDGDEEAELDHDDEPGVLLVFLNAKRRRVTKSLYRTLPDFPIIELRLLYFLTSQLDHELISHNVTVSDLEKWVREVFLKLHDVLDVMEGLR